MNQIPVWKRSTKSILCMSILLLFTLTLSACSDNKTEELQGPADAIAVFKQRCMSCHGADLTGKMGPESNLQQIGSKLTAEEIVTIVQEGGERMPAQSNIDEADVQKVAEWLATLK